MVTTIYAPRESGVAELLLRLEMAAHRISDADYIGAMRSLRYWDRGYDLGPLPRAVLDALETHSLAARRCLASGDADGATRHVREAAALASARPRRRRPARSRD